MVCRGIVLKDYSVEIWPVYAGDFHELLDDVGSPVAVLQANLVSYFESVYHCFPSALSVDVPVAVFGAV